MSYTAQPYSLVIFDLDGTLVDSFPWFLRVVNDVAKAFDFKPIERGDVASLRRAGSRAILRHLDIPLWKVPRIAAHMRKIKRQQLHELPLFDGVPDMLQALRKQGIRVALVSSDSEANARLQLGDNAALFSDFACGASLFGKAGKFKRIVRRAGLEPSAAIAIGDEMRDHEAADAAGISFGAVAWGYADPDALRARRPQAFFETVADIPRLLCKGAAMTSTVTDNAAEHRFELAVGDHLALAYYRLTPGVITFTHTEVPPALSGQGIGSKLARGALDQVRGRGLKVVAKCPFIAAFIAKNAEFGDLLA
jgi:phosphoglycolate phosphatase